MTAQPYTAEEVIARQRIFNNLTLFQCSAERIIDALAEARRTLAQIEAKTRQHHTHALRPDPPIPR